MKINTKIFFIFLITVFTGIVLIIKPSRAFFSDTIAISGNTFSTGFWSPSPSSSPLPNESPSPSPSISPSPSESPLETARIVINEVYYNPDETHKEGLDENAYEWVELYNAGNAQANLKNWKIVDLTSSIRTITTNDYFLLPNSFVVIAKVDGVKTIWSISDSSFVTLGYDIGSGLNNLGDTVTLKNDNNITIDEMSYGPSPASGPIAIGHSMERNPAGKDTDSASDFVDRSSPTPGY